MRPMTRIRLMLLMRVLFSHHQVLDLSRGEACGSRMTLTQCEAGVRVTFATLILRTNALSTRPALMTAAAAIAKSEQ